MKSKKKKRSNKKIKEFFNSLKPILFFSFIINIILLSFIYYLKTSSHIYLFSGSNEYIRIDSGTLSFDSEVNYLMGNNIEYINEKDNKIKEIKIGYYVMNNEELEEIITYYEKFENDVSLKETLKNLVGLNVSESTKDNIIFKRNNYKDLESKLYIVMEIKLKNSEKILSKLKLDVSKIK